MPSQVIHTDQAPKAIGPYSQAMRVGDLVFMAGQIPLDPATMQMVEGDFEKESRRVFENIKAVIEEAGGTFTSVTGDAGPGHQALSCAATRPREAASVTTKPSTRASSTPRFAYAQSPSRPPSPNGPSR